MLCCAAASVIGHVWPMWHSFRGGKGAATLVGTLVILAPDLLIPILLVWGIVLTSFGYVGLATIAAGFTGPIYLAITRLPDDQPLFIYCTSLAAYIIFSHRSNIQRMRAGTESRNERLLVFRKNRAPTK